MPAAAADDLAGSAGVAVLLRQLLCTLLLHKMQRMLTLISMAWSVLHSSVETDWCLQLCLGMAEAAGIDLQPRNKSMSTV